ncbi:DUF4084 domain-containing protein [Planococcus glaciei]|uniref:DUF4084 domain-containing protein n=1 Tax=Planococcus glaciei TaxID=459472 RepID=UPI0003DF44D9|nr:DUF4084 domain-containing protein [Planococcus glaciei]ETP67370.1 hypothetical protein G159_19690 [Planococcus glaciei CHR43]
MKTILQPEPHKLFVSYLFFHITVYYIWLFYGGFTETVQTAGTYTIPFSASLVATLTLYLVYRKKQGPRKYFWLLFALGCLSYAIAEGIRIYYSVIPKSEVPYPGWADLFYFLQILFFIAAFLQQLWDKKKNTNQIKFLFDICIIMAVFTAISWHYVIQYVFSEGSLSPALLATSIGYPVGDLLLFFCAISFYMRADILFPRPVLALICASAGVQIFADTAYLYYSTKSDSYVSGTLFDPLWTVGLLLTALAGIYALQEQRKETDAPSLAAGTVPANDEGVSLRMLLPYFSLVLLFIVMVFEKDGPMNGLIVGAGTSVALIILRQVFTMLENQKLLAQYHDLTAILEEKIEQRTTELSTKNEQLAVAVQKMEHMAYHDALSGLPNRRLFLNKLNAAIASAERHSHQLAVVFVDLDRFKNINDTFGHEFGDLLLQGFSKKMAENLRQIDTVSRQGGDEFTIILNDIKATEDIVPLVKRIQSILEKPVVVNGQELHVSMSIGIAVYPQDGKTTEELMKHADIAMYHAKENGKNNYQFFSDEMQSTMFHKVQLENDLREALDNEEFILHYQPQVEAATGKIIGMETLIRWQAPDGTIISPAEFIPLAEDTRLIIPIGKWVLHNSCMQAKKWHDAGHTHLKLAVNLSPLQFMHDELMDTVQDVLEATGFDASSLELEITESVAVYDAEKTIARMQALRNMGVRIALDDFGTGYSSLVYLKKFPINSLKIARPFIQDMVDNPKDKALVEAIVSMAHSLELSVIAEGVETHEQLTSLKTLKCDEIQGYFFSKPLAAETFASLINKKMDSINMR